MSNDKKRKQKTKARRDRIWFIPVFALMFIGFLLYFNIEKQEQPTIDKVPKQATTSTDPNQPTMAQQVFVKNILLPTLDQAMISYPIASIHNRFIACMKRINTGQIALGVSATPSPQGAFAAAIKDPDGKLRILISVPVAMQTLSDINDDRELFTDYMVGIMLHEEYHLIVQGGYCPGELSFDEMAQSESEAWWFTIEEVYLPMIRAGRLQCVDQATMEGLTAYRQAKGDKNHSAWVAFSKSATGLQQPRRE